MKSRGLISDHIISNLSSTFYHVFFIIKMCSFSPNPTFLTHSICVAFFLCLHEGTTIVNLKAEDKDQRDTINSKFTFSLEQEPKEPKIELKQVEDVAHLTFKGCFDYDVRFYLHHLATVSNILFIMIY